jgi:hypothetical protein
MKMADSGFLPAYNDQFATDTKSTAIAGASVDNIGFGQDAADERRPGRAIGHATAPASRRRRLR